MLRLELLEQGALVGRMSDVQGSPNRGPHLPGAQVPGSGRSPAEGNGNPLQYSLVNPGYRDFSPWGHKELDRNK